MAKWKIVIGPVERWDFLREAEKAKELASAADEPEREQMFAALQAAVTLFANNPIGREGLREYGAKITGVTGERVTIRLFRGSVIPGENLPGRVK